MLLLQRASAPRANQQFLPSQILLPFANSASEATCERAVGRITKLANLLATTFSQEVRSHAPLQPGHLPFPATRSACGSGVPQRQARLQGRALS